MVDLPELGDLGAEVFKVGVRVLRIGRPRFVNNREALTILVYPDEWRITRENIKLNEVICLEGKMWARWAKQGRCDVE